MFRSISNNSIEGSQKTISSDGVYKIVQEYSQKLGFKIKAHSLRATAANNALDNQADIVKWVKANKGTKTVIGTQDNRA